MPTYSDLATSLTSLDAVRHGVARGGEREQELLAAVAAADAGRVKQVLASGADPNKMALHEGHYESPWRLALHWTVSMHPHNKFTCR